MDKGWSMLIRVYLGNLGLEISWPVSLAQSTESYKSINPVKRMPLRLNCGALRLDSIALSVASGELVEQLHGLDIRIPQDNSVNLPLR